jgi:spore germination protein KC
MSAVKLVLKVFFLVSFVLMTLLLGGCWDNIELNSISIVSGIGVDAVPDNPRKLHVTLQSANVKAFSTSAGGGGGGDELPFILNEQQSISITDAITAIERRTSRALFTHHNQVVIFGKDYCKNGVQSAIDTFMREDEMRAETSLVVADGTARDMLSIKVEPEKLASQWIPRMQETISFNIGKIDVSVLDFSSSILKPSAAAVLPIIKVVSTPFEENQLEKAVKETENKQQTTESQSEEGQKQEEGGEGQQETKKDEAGGGKKEEKKGGGEAETKDLCLTGLAVFKGPYLVGELDIEQIRGYRWLKGDVTATKLELNVGEGAANIDISNARFKKKVRLDENNKLIVDFTVEADAAIQESFGIDDSEPKQYVEVITKAVNEKIKSEIESCVTKAKELKADIFGILNALYEKQPTKYKAIKENKDEVFASFEMNTDIKITVQDTGKLRKSVVEKWWNYEH